VRIASVSIEYPAPASPFRGTFVKRRVAALAGLTDLHVIHLQPWFPVLRPRAVLNGQPHSDEFPTVSRPTMFYLPGVLKRWDSFWVRRIVLPSLRKLEAQGPVDVLDAHFGYPEGVGCVRAARKLGRPVFITLRGLERQILQSTDRRAQMLWALEHCTGIICVSQSLYDLARAQGIAPAKLRVIANAVERKVFHAGPQQEAKQILGIPAGHRLIVSVGMLVRGKGQHLLVEAFDRLRQRIGGLRLALIGGRTHERDYPKLLERMVFDLGLKDLVYMPGPQPPERVAVWLRAADLFALPTYSEGCCNAILEALACGAPVVTTPVGDNAKLVDPPHRGLLVPPDNCDSLVKGMELALSRAWDRQQIANFGADYTWQEVARQTVEFFRERLDATIRSGIRDQESEVEAF